MIDFRSVPIIVCLPIALLVGGCGGEGTQSDEARGEDELTAPFLFNNWPIRNENGNAATFSTAGFVDLRGAFFTPQGTNGRHCGSCHAVGDGWSFSAARMQRIFDRTDGLDPIFNLLDADRPDAFADMEALRAATVDERRDAFSMLLQAKLTRAVALPATREYEVVDLNDPFGVSTPSRIFFFRRVMPTANLGSDAVHWDNALGVAGDLHAGLANQARGSIRNAQQGTPVEEIVEEIVNYEAGLFHAQLSLNGLRLDRDGGLGGPQNRAAQPFVAGPFSLYDAWAENSDPLKAQIARGQALFNDGKPGQARCGGCHNAANDGGNVSGALFDIGTSACNVAKGDMARFVLRNSATGEERCTTDPGRGLRSGLWSEVDRFDVPSLRGVGSRGEYFHNGIATTLMEVIQHYERTLNFNFTGEERDDLVTFLKAL